MSLPPERVDATHDIIYLAKHPLYEFVLERSAPISAELRSQPSPVQLRFTGQPQQQGIVLPLAALERFHEALSRLLDYIKQERARGPAIPPSGSSMEGSMAPTTEHRERDSRSENIEAANPTTYSNHPVSVEKLCSLSGIVLTGLIALLSWAMYSLSASKGDFRPLQATAAQEALALASAPAMPRSNGEAMGLSPSEAMDLSPSETMGLSSQMVVGELPPSVPLSTAKDHDDSPPHVYLRIQSPAQYEAAQRLVAQLQQKGYIVPEAVTLMPKGPSRTEVRYFSPTEAEEAAAIAVLLHQPYRPPATSSYVRGRKDTSRNGHRRYEVWLGPEPRSRRTAP
jgi:hypothetical protein